MCRDSFHLSDPTEPAISEAQIMFGNDQASCNCPVRDRIMAAQTLPGLNLYFKPKFSLLGFIHPYCNKKTLQLISHAKKSCCSNAERLCFMRKLINVCR